MSKVRIIVQQTNAAAAAHVGGPITTEYRTFDVEAPELVAIMRSSLDQFCHRSIVGVEVLGGETIQ